MPKMHRRHPRKSPNSHRFDSNGRRGAETRAGAMQKSQRKLLAGGIKKLMLRSKPRISGGRLSAPSPCDDMQLDCAIRLHSQSVRSHILRGVGTAMSFWK